MMKWQKDQTGRSNPCALQNNVGKAGSTESVLFIAIPWGIAILLA